MRDSPPAAPPPPPDVCLQLERRLRRETRGEVLFDHAARGRYATDASIYQIMPVGVLVPTTSHDVAAAIDIARDLNVPVLARGGGTSQCGQTTGAALVIDNCKYLRRILDVDVAGAHRAVEPGLVLDHLNAALKPHGLWFPVDVSTSAQATLGGMAGNNSLRLPLHRLRQHGAQRARRHRLAFGRLARSSSGRWRRWRPRRAQIAAFVRDLAAAPRARDRRRAGRRCCVAWAATTSIFSTTRASVPTPTTAASTSRIC